MDLVWDGLLKIPKENENEKINVFSLSEQGFLEADSLTSQDKSRNIIRIEIADFSWCDCTKVFANSNFFQFQLKWSIPRES